jgi:hypothetical protein
MSVVVAKVYNRSVRLVNTGIELKLQLTKSYAESKLSTSALKYAEKTDTHYLWNWGKTAFIVIYELPSLFDEIHFTDIMRYLLNYCFEYVKENNLNDQVVYSRYLENSEKSLK